jgi:hypothetical protein
MDTRLHRYFIGIGLPGPKGSIDYLMTLLPIKKGLLIPQPPQGINQFLNFFGQICLLSGFLGGGA